MHFADLTLRHDSDVSSVREAITAAIASQPPALKTGPGPIAEGTDRVAPQAGGPNIGGGGHTQLNVLYTATGPRPEQAAELQATASPAAAVGGSRVRRAPRASQTWSSSSPWPRAAAGAASTQNTAVGVLDNVPVAGDEVPGRSFNLSRR